MPKKRKPGPALGTTYDNADAIKLSLVKATIKLLRSGTLVGDLTSIAITDCAKVDKMYVRRFFGDRDHLFLASILHLVETQSSLVGTSLFRANNSTRINPDVVLAFSLFTYLAKKPDLEPQLRGLTEAVLNAYRRQVENEFGLSGEPATQQAVLGLMAMVGFLSTGHLLPVDLRDITKWLESRPDVLRALGRQNR